MSINGKIRLLVASDIHAFAHEPSTGQRPSYAKVGEPNSSTQQFIEIAKTHKFHEFDLVVAPGDLGDRADPACLKYSWQFLMDVAQVNSSPVLLASTGNHDVDSRSMQSDFDVKGSLLSLDPSYPCFSNQQCIAHANDFERQLWYWARNLYLYSQPEYRIVVMNSCAYHGMGAKENEFEHGRVSDFSIKSIKSAIERDESLRSKKQIPSPKINVLICHHHLEKDGLIEDQDYSEMRGAHSLIELLSDSSLGRWLVIHGHKHRARFYQKGGATGPLVLSAASFAATRDRDYSNTSPNQVHIVELDFDAMDKHDFYPAGNIFSWSWVPSAGWVFKDAPNGGLPPEMGFGFRDSLDGLARKIATHQQSTQTGTEWLNLVKEHEKMKFLDYKQIEELKKILSAKYQIDLLLCQNMKPLFVAGQQS